jgi:predicted dehydrogenase
VSALRIGVIGVGFGATVHVPAFLSEGWEVPAIWGRSPDRTREAAERLGVVAPHEDWRELMARDDLDAIAITTPPAPHREMALAALAAGKHVLCEKPFALDAAEATAMAEAARAAGRTAMVAHEFRHAPQRAHIRQLLDEGYVGEPRFASIELLIGRPPPAEPPPLAWGSRAGEGGGLLGALGSHYIDGLRHWFGDVREVSGRLAVARPERRDPATGAVASADADDTFAFTLGFESGAFATMTATSAASPATGARLHLVGSDGVLEAAQPGPNPEPDGVVLGGRGDARRLEELPMPAALVPFEDDRDNRLMAFRLLVRDFEHGIRDGESPAPSFEDGAATQRVLDAVRQSSATGGLVTL